VLPDLPVDPVPGRGGVSVVRKVNQLSEHTTTRMNIAPLVGRDDLLRAIGREYHERHPLTRMSARLAISARLPLRRVRPLVRLTATAAQRAGAGRLAHALCSLAFSYQYWRGVADELGGGEAALALVSKPA